MNEFARLHSGDELFKRIMIASLTGGVFFALYMMMY